MKILHYALGFPPYRTGGLTKYCLDLMLTQIEQGYDVSLLWPGQIGFMYHKLSIRKGKDYAGIHNYEIINPLPVALDEGITDISSYIVPCEEEVYYNFIQKLSPDVIHIHTLMGLHKELVDITKKLGIKTIFTTHDYYGICPKVTLFRNGHTCEDDNDCYDCVNCNSSVLSLRKIVIMQSPIYRVLKNSALIKVLRKKHRGRFFDETDLTQIKLTTDESVKRAGAYRTLRKYYISILEKIDIIHFNSTVSEKIYKRYLTPLNSLVISISHREIVDHRVRKNFTHDKLSITYLAPVKPFKGFDKLKLTLDELWAEGYRDFELSIFSITNRSSSYMKIRDGYQYAELPTIFEKTDILIAPSMWYETFGFVVLEALSYGVPVIVSENVGAKDILAGFEEDFVVSLYEDDLKEKLRNIISERAILVKANDLICEMCHIKTMSEHVHEIEKLFSLGEDNV